MRIIGGIYKGFNLSTFNGKGIRPTPSIIREALFDILGTKIIESEFLDLFAGTGAVGIEAFSRGARRITFVELNLEGIALIRRNIAKIDHQECFDIIRNHSIRAIKKLKTHRKKFDIVFLDPPYDHREYLLESLQEIELNSILKNESIIIVQHQKKEDLNYNSQRIIFLKEKNYGKSKISIFRFQE